MTAFGSNEHLALMGVLFAIGLAELARRHIAQYLAHHRVPHHKLRASRPMRAVFAARPASDPSGLGTDAGSQLHPGSAAESHQHRVEPPAPGRPSGLGAGLTPVDVAAPDSAASTGLNPPSGDACAVTTSGAAQARSAA